MAWLGTMWDLPSAPAGPRGWDRRAMAAGEGPWDGGSTRRAVPVLLSEKELLKVSLSRHCLGNCDFLPFGTPSWQIPRVWEKHSFVTELLACSKGGHCGFISPYEEGMTATLFNPVL